MFFVVSIIYGYNNHAKNQLYVFICSCYLEKAKALLQDFNKLSDELRVVEEELKSSLQTNEIKETRFHSLEESQPSGNNKSL